ncbi:MAG: RHS repeat domain-containing protein [Dehalococcoidia bacterium]
MYDPPGNRIAVDGSFARTLLPDPVPSATYDEANQQLAFGDKAMTYDPNGNVETITDPTGTTSFTWDGRNRLSALSGPTVTASFQYDAMERRVEKIINASLSTYQYDSTDIIRDVLDGAEAVYLRTLNIDETLGRTDAGSTQFYLADAVRSTIGLTDSTGVSVTTYTYEPFGRASASGTLSANAFQFTGRENDLTRFYYYRARYYDPVLGRFLSEDPLKQLRIGNLYAYAGSSPLTLVDPSGLLEFSTFGGVGGRVVAPGTGVAAFIGFRSGTNGFGVGRIEAFATGKAFPAGGAAVGRGFFVGFALRDVSKLPQLEEVFVDSRLGSISLFFDRDELVGLAVGGPSEGLGAGVVTPNTTVTLFGLKSGFNFPTLLPDFAIATGPEGSERRILGARKE